MLMERAPGPFCQRTCEPGASPRMERGGFPLGGTLKVISGFSLCDNGLQGTLKAGRVLERGARKSGAPYTSLSSYMSPFHLLPSTPTTLQPHRPAYSSNRLSMEPQSLLCIDSPPPCALASSFLTQLLFHVFVPMREPFQTMCTFPNSILAASYFKTACLEWPPSALVSPVNTHTSFSQPSVQCLLLRAFPAFYSCSRSYCFHRFLVSAWLAPGHSLILLMWLKPFS